MLDDRDRNALCELERQLATENQNASDDSPMPSSDPRQGQRTKAGRSAGRSGLPDPKQARRTPGGVSC